MIKQYFLATLILSSTLTGCITTSTLPADQRPQNWGQVIQPDYNFYKMSDSVFRSEQPSKQLIPLLAQHDIEREFGLSRF